MRKSQLILNKQKQKALNDFKPTVVVNYEPNERPDNIASDSFDSMLNLGVSKGELRTMERMDDRATDIESSEYSGDDSESIATDSQESEASTVKKTSSTSSEYDIVNEEEEIFKPLADANGVYDDIIKNLKDFKDNGHKAKNWAFTIWRKTKKIEFSDKDWAKLIDDLLKLADGFAHFIIFGDELGHNKNYSELQRQHLQGFIQVPKPLRMSQLKKMFPNHTHFGKMYSTVEANIAYCSKDEQNGAKIYRAGKVPTTEGHRSDRDKIVEAIQAGKTAEQIASENPAGYLAFGKTIDKCISLREKAASRPNHQVIYITGWPRSGKSRFVQLRYEDEEIYIKKSHKWWDFYNKTHKCVVFDDINFKNFDFRELLNYLDIYQFQAETKGGGVHIKCDRTYITSSEPLISAKTLMDLTDFDYEQLKGRIHYIVCLHNMKIYKYNNENFEHELTDIKVEDFDICGKLLDPKNLEFYKSEYLPSVVRKSAEWVKKGKYKFKYSDVNL